MEGQKQVREKDLEGRSKSSKIYLILQKQRIEWKKKNERNNT